MPSRQDQLHSYQFMVQRVVAALVMRETDPAQSPFRRAAGATLASVLVAAIALGGIGVYGLIVGGGSKSWRNADAVIVEKETGALFVFRDERLHPVLNYASALLIVGSPAPRRVLISRKSIEGVPRGTPLGISGAPDSLPDPRRLLSPPWTLCSTRPGQAEDKPDSVLLVGAGGAGAVETGESIQDRAVLVSPASGGDVRLVWHHRQYRIRGQDKVLAAFNWSRQQQVIEVADAVAKAIPSGEDLQPIDIRGRGEPSDLVGNAVVGEVFEVTNINGGRRYAVTTREGMAEITQLQATLIQGDPATLDEVGKSEPTQISSARYQSMPKANSLVRTDDSALPVTTPEVVVPDQRQVCAVFTSDEGVSDIRINMTVPDASNAARTGARTPSGKILADRVVVVPGRGAVVESVSAPGAQGGTLSIVTDLGMQFPVENRDVLGMLGYGQARPARIPSSLVDLVPSGRALDPEVARQPAV